jgi:CP family cyanate transporter-like MFS transporter
MPTLVGHWLPGHIGFATALYVNGLLVGEVIGVALTTPFAVPLTGSWGGALALWSIPLLANIALLACALRARLVTRPGLRGSQVQSNWWPDWRNGAMLRCGLMLGCAATVYFTANAFIPDFLHARAKPHLVEAALTALNGTQIPASLLLLAIADRIVGKSGPLIAVGLMGAGAAGGLIVAASDPAIIFFSGILGFVASFVLILVLALPPLLAEQNDVHRFSAGVFLIGYAMAFASPVISGALWDATHIPGLVFATVGGAAALLALLATTLRFSRPAQ